MNANQSSTRSFHVGLALTLAILLSGLIPMPISWANVRFVIDSARSRELNRSDREKMAGGYYQGLIGVDTPDGTPDELSQLMMGKPVAWLRQSAVKFRRVLYGDFLMFELRPNEDSPLRGQRFTTNDFGMRDRPYTLAKPPHVFRIAVLGSSIDMGWGVGTESTYENLLEDWLNAHAEKRGIERRFEVLNFAVFAYSPLQRLEALRRKASRFKPDMVIYSATTLDPRFMEIYLCDLLEKRVQPREQFAKQVIRDAGITRSDLQVDAERKLKNESKNVIKAKLRPYYWRLYDETMTALAAECRSLGVPLACIIIPRATTADAPEFRAEEVAKLRRVLAPHADATFDLSNTFDSVDLSEVEVASTDDHPNTAGHHLLFRALAGALVKDKLYETLFPSERRLAVSDEIKPIGRAGESAHRATLGESFKP